MFVATSIQTTEDFNEYLIKSIISTAAQSPGFVSCSTVVAMAAILNI